MMYNLFIYDGEQFCRTEGLIDEPIKNVFCYMCLNER